ncbi:hypothetical protein PM082_002093 [Marasmius tenuissimus]|nr:hypothetical protein PM082_002093 [Marasmius tenuissimus]
MVSEADYLFLPSRTSLAKGCRSTSALQSLDFGRKRARNEARRNLREHSPTTSGLRKSNSENPQGRPSYSKSNTLV